MSSSPNLMYFIKKLHPINSNQSFSSTTSGNSASTSSSSNHSIMNHKYSNRLSRIDNSNRETRMSDISTSSSSTYGCVVDEAEENFMNTLDRDTRSSMSKLEMICESSDLSKSFTSYCGKIHAEEYFLFILECKKHSLAETERERINIGKDLLSKFIYESSSHFINLRSETRNDLIHAEISSLGNPDFFARSRKEISAEIVNSEYFYGFLCMVASPRGVGERGSPSSCSP